MNKTQLIDAITDRRPGSSRKDIADVVQTLVDTVYAQVAKGEKVTISGFGTFERRDRPARRARNPRTGEAVKVKKTTVPAFRPGTEFKDFAAGRRKPAKATKTAVKTVAAKAPAKTAAKTVAAKTVASPPAKTAARTAAPAKTAATRPVKTVTAKTTAAAAKRTPAKTATKTATKTAPARKAPAKRSR